MTMSADRPPPTDEVLIDLNDFNSTEIRVSMMNSTTQVEVRDGVRVFGTGPKAKTEESPDIKVRFVEFTEKGLKIEFPEKSCANAHMLLLQVELVCAEKVVQALNLSVKVAAMEALPSGHDLVTVDLVQYEQKEWDAFRGFFNNRQDEIDRFFEAAKG